MNCRRENTSAVGGRTPLREFHLGRLISEHLLTDAQIAVKFSQALTNLLRHISKHEALEGRYPLGLGGQKQAI